MSMQPFAMNVVTTPMPVDSTNCRSCALARLRIVPFPARMSGRFASRISSHAWSTIVSSGTGRRNRRTGTGGCVASSRAMSSGSSMRQAPGFSVRASRTALRTTSGMLLGCRIVCPHLVTGLNMPTTSMI